MGNEHLLPIASAIYKLESKLESVKAEMVRLDGASRVTQGHVKSFDSWVLSAKEELTKLVEEGKSSLDSANLALQWLNKARVFVSELSTTTSRVHVVKQGEAIGIADTIQTLKNVVEEEVKKQVLAEQQAALLSAEAAAEPAVQEEREPPVESAAPKRGRPKSKTRADDPSTRLGKAVQDIKSRRRRAQP